MHFSQRERLPVPYRSDHLSHFPTLAGMQPPRITVALAWMIGIGIALSALIMAYVPWVQTAIGDGQIVALDPADRAQEVSALIAGRVDRWFVQDGQHVDRGDPIARVVDVDPNLLSRLAAERAQVEAEIAAVRQGQAVANIDVGRMRQLLVEGLVARRDLEQAQIKVADAAAKLAESRAKLNRIDSSSTPPLVGRWFLPAPSSRWSRPSGSSARWRSSSMAAMSR